MHAIVDAASFEGRRKLIAQELGARAIKLVASTTSPVKKARSTTSASQGRRRSCPSKAAA